MTDKPLTIEALREKWPGGWVQVKSSALSALLAYLDAGLYRVHVRRNGHTEIDFMPPDEEMDSIEMFAGTVEECRTWLGGQRAAIGVALGVEARELPPPACLKHCHHSHVDLECRRIEEWDGPCVLPPGHDGECTPVLIEGDADLLSGPREPLSSAETVADMTAREVVARRKGDDPGDLPCPHDDGTEDS